MSSRAGAARGGARRGVSVPAWRARRFDEGDARREGEGRGEVDARGEGGVGDDGGGGEKAHRGKAHVAVAAGGRGTRCAATKPAEGMVER